MYTHRATPLHIVSSTCQQLKSRDIRCTISDIGQSVKCTLETDSQADSPGRQTVPVYWIKEDFGTFIPAFVEGIAESSRKVLQKVSPGNNLKAKFTTLLGFLPHTEWPTARRELHQKRVCTVFARACSQADVLHLPEPFPALLLNNTAFYRHLRDVKEHHKWQE